MLRFRHLTTKAICAMSRQSYTWVVPPVTLTLTRAAANRLRLMMIISCPSFKLQSSSSPGEVGVEKVTTLTHCRGRYRGTWPCQSQYLSLTHFVTARATSINILTEYQSVELQTSESVEKHVPVKRKYEREHGKYPTPLRTLHAGRPV